MSNPERQILTPGAPAVAERKKPGPKPKAASAAEDGDLDEFESDELPETPEVKFTPAQQAEIQRMIGAAVMAAKSSQDPATAARLASATMDSQKLPSQEAAIAMSENSLRQGLRPRAILTTDGWYTHPESAKTAASVGVTGIMGLANSSGA